MFATLWYRILARNAPIGRRFADRLADTFADRLADTILALATGG